MKKHFSKLTLAIILALVMGLAFAAPAMADPLVPSVRFDLGVTKHLAMPAGTAPPATTFTFDFRQMVADDGPPAGYIVLDPADATATIPQASISFPATGDNFLSAETVGQVTTWSAQALDVLNGSVWPHGGIFYFVVTETQTAPTFTSPEYIVLSQEFHVIYVQVVNCPITGNLVPTNVVGFPGLPAVPGTPGIPGTDDVVVTGPKHTTVTPGTPGEPGEPGEPGTDPYGDHSELEFTNNFTRTRVGTLTDPALAVSKTTTAFDLNNNVADLTLQFEFNMTINIPQLALDRTPAFAGPVTATITDPAGVPIAGRAPVTFTGTLPTLTATFTLAHNEQLRIPELPVGSTYSVTEAAVQRYAPTAIVTIAGVPGAEQGDRGSANMNTPLTVTGYTSDIAPPPAAVAPFNLAAFTNTHHPIEIYGLFIGTMPFMVALFGATVILAMMVASRSRQRIEQLPIAY